MGFLGFANVYAMRVNLSVAIVAMVNNSRSDIPDFDNNTDVCPMPPFSNTTIPDVRIMSHKTCVMRVSIIIIIREGNNTFFVYSLT